MVHPHGEFEKKSRSEWRAKVVQVYGQCSLKHVCICEVNVCNLQLAQKIPLLDSTHFQTDKVI